MYARMLKLQSKNIICPEMYSKLWWICMIPWNEINTFTLSYSILMKIYIQEEGYTRKTLFQSKSCVQGIGAVGRESGGCDRTWIWLYHLGHTKTQSQIKKVLGQEKQFPCHTPFHHCKYMSYFALTPYSLQCKYRVWHGSKYHDLMLFSFHT